MTTQFHRMTDKEVIEALPKGRAFLAVETASLNTMATTVKRGNFPDESSRRLLYKKRWNVNFRCKMKGDALKMWQA